MRTSPTLPQPWPWGDYRMGDTFYLVPRDRWVRIQYNGVMVADTKRPMFFSEYRDKLEVLLERQNNNYWMAMPFFYCIPKEDVKMEYLVPSDDEIYDQTFHSKSVTYQPSEPHGSIQT